MGPGRTTNTSPDEIREFFKVYLPAFSTQHLCIPPDFVKQCGGILPKKAILMDYTGKSWSVGITKVGDRMLIKNGWPDFSIHHSLEYGDFLLFRYDGNSVFRVKIFGKNGCKKKRASTVNRPSATIKMEPQDEEDEEGESRRRPARSCKRKFSDLNITRMGMSGGNADDLFKLKRKLPVGCINKYQVERLASPQRLQFVSRMTQSSMYSVHIPIAVAKQYNVDLKPEMILRDANGRAWPVQVKERRGGSCMSMTTGWPIVRRSLGLKVGKRCLFEIVLGAGNNCSEMNVRVLS